MGGDMKSVIVAIILLCFPKSFATEQPIVVIIPSYNNIEWFEWNLTSILTQEYHNYRVIYVNDCSSDGTGEAVDNYLSERGIDYHVIDFDNSSQKSIRQSTKNFSQLVNKEPHFFTLINNTFRNGALANLYRGIQSCLDDEIVVTVDGDDWLYHDHVLTQINSHYSENEIWLTHGRFIEYPHNHSNWGLNIPPQIVNRGAFRRFRCPSHLRTFYAWLFKKIKLEDLLYNGQFFPMTWDMAMMYPMIEMAGERHAFIEEVNYVYNMANQINDNKVNPDLQNQLDRYIRSMPPYKRLTNKEDKNFKN